MIAAILLSVIAFALGFLGGTIYCERMNEETQRMQKEAKRQFDDARRINDKTIALNEKTVALNRNIGKTLTERMKGNP